MAVIDIATATQRRLPVSFELVALLILDFPFLSGPCFAGLKLPLQGACQLSKISEKRAIGQNLPFK